MSPSKPQFFLVYTQLSSGLPASFENWPDWCCWEACWRQRQQPTPAGGAQVHCGGGGGCSLGPSGLSRCNRHMHVESPSFFRKTSPELVAALIKGAGRIKSKFLLVLPRAADQRPVLVARHRTWGVQSQSLNLLRDRP